jgi:hypothetical protein
MIRVDPDKKAIGMYFRKDAPIVTKLIESLDEKTLYDLNDKKTLLKYTSEVFDEVLDERFFKLVKVPRDTTIITDINYICQIDSDLMVAIDHTYDESVHATYQEHRLHKVKVILDPIIAILQSDQQLCRSLQDGLINAEVVIERYNDVEGIHETSTHKINCEIFVFETYSHEYIQTKLVIQHCKI